MRLPNANINAVPVGRSFKFPGSGPHPHTQLEAGHNAPWRTCITCDGNGTVILNAECCEEYMPDGACCHNHVETHKTCLVCDGDGIIPKRPN